jgi:hypothetical protein
MYSQIVGRDVMKIGPMPGRLRLGEHRHLAGMRHHRLEG